MQHKKLYKYLELIFFTAVFILSIQPLLDFDLWFHLKSGEIIAQKGIIFYDVFSHSASGRLWYPYEWLFQLGMYYIKNIFGLEMIKYVTAAIITYIVYVLYRIFRVILSLNIGYSLLCCYFFYISIFEFISPRPHLPAYAFLLTNLFLIWLYVYKNRNLLFLTIPVTLIWANMHGSVFLDVYLFGTYTFMMWLSLRGGAKATTKQSYTFKVTDCFAPEVARNDSEIKVLAGYTVLTAILTILPPLGLTQYKLLVYFFQNMNIISKFIEEWVPLKYSPVLFWIYTATLILVLLAFFKTLKNMKDKSGLFMLLPIIPFVFAAYTASRNIFPAYIGIILILGWTLKAANINLRNRFVNILLVVVAIAYIWVYFDKKAPLPYRYPVKAADFIEKNDLKGNMYNEYGYGGYLLYRLYPKYKVFYDGRTDVYLCCEMKDNMQLGWDKNFPDNEYKKVMDGIWNKYKISYVIMETLKHTVLRKISRVLTDDPDWSLVYWDDATEIFVRHDGLNDSLLEKYGATAATPYNQNPFIKDKEDIALEEYIQMADITDSAKSRNAIGYIYLTKGKISEARDEFLKAIELDPNNESPYMNLAEIYAKDNDLNMAIKLYRQAKILAPDRGLIYIRLGQLIVQNGDARDEALTVWKEGLEKTVDDEAKNTLRKMINE